MKRMLQMALAIFLCFGTAANALAGQITITDDLGREVSLNVPIKRAVVFNKYNAEFFRAVGGTQVLVGIGQGTQADQLLAGLSKDAIAGQNQRTPNYEKIVALKPDVVVFQEMENGRMPLRRWRFWYSGGRHHRLGCGQAR